MVFGQNRFGKGNSRGTEWHKFQLHSEELWVLYILAKYTCMVKVVTTVKQQRLNTRAMKLKLMAFCSLLNRVVNDILGHVNTTDL